jgi:hypothetical protein
MNGVAVAVSAVLLLASVAWTQETTTPANKAATPEGLKAEIESLKAPRVAWREIAWKSCLIEGLKESREKKKPVLLWVFIDRPIDDARC